MTQLPYSAVIMDLDRTLLRTDKSVSACTLDILEKWKEAGAYLLAATARPERAITEYQALIGFHAVTTLNGARTMTPAGVYENAIGAEDATAVIGRLEETEGMVISVEAENGIYANAEIPVWQPKVMKSLRELPGKEKIYKVLASHPEIPPEEIRIGLPDSVYSTVADKKLRQYMSRTATKWEGVKQMLRSLGVEPARAVFFGDDNDDIGPIRECGCGVAVGNALDCVKECADHITLSNDEDGVAVFLDRMLRGEEM